jgi:hypothetical protein
MRNIWKDYEPYKIAMESYLEYGYVKMYRKREKTHVAYKAKNGKTIKIFTGCNYQREAWMKVRY